MKLTKKTFQVLDTLDRQEVSSQRQLADRAGISLGQVNYILRSLLEKGFVKIDNFRKNPKKISYIYLLTPKGIEAKSRLAVSFVINKINEYNGIRERLTDQLKMLEKDGIKRVVFLGLPIVNEFLGNLIKEEKLDLELINHFTDWRDLIELDSASFDVALLFADDPEDLNELKAAPDFPKDKLVALWG
jgi:EPS-associated MarR family transcriptional regulator